MPFLWSAPEMMKFILGVIGVGWLGCMATIAVSQPELFFPFLMLSGMAAGIVYALFWNMP
jgi:hypothetical protein